MFHKIPVIPVFVAVLNNLYVGLSIEVFTGLCEYFSEQIGYLISGFHLDPYDT
jgi:hypothetical protein